MQQLSAQRSGERRARAWRPERGTSTIIGKNVFYSIFLLGALGVGVAVSLG
eukprot:COSAG02_NODE_1294_length_13401_cov_32.784393_7_plen_51_part_00